MVARATVSMASQVNSLNLMIMDRVTALEKGCPVLIEDPRENCDSSQDSVSLSDSLNSWEEFGYVTGKSPTSTGLSPEPKYNVVTYPGNSPLVRAVALGEDRNAPWRKDMEDASVLINNYGGKEGTSFFGVFDGFHGPNSAELAARELSVLLLEQLVKFDPSFSLASEQKDFLSKMESLYERDGPASTDLGTTTKEQQMTQAVIAAFAHMDRILGLGRNETSRFRWSGCTSVICVVDQDTTLEEEVEEVPKGLHGTIHIANCGNIHAVLYQDDKSFSVTKDHSTANPKERKRILKEGGTISTNKQHGLVEGLLRATRALGNYGNCKLRKVVPPKPYYVPLSLEPSYDLLVLGSSGLWENLLPEDVASIVRRCIRACRRHHRHLKAMEKQPGYVSGSILTETAEDLDNPEKYTEASPNEGTVGDQQGAAESKVPEDPSGWEDAGRVTGLEVNYEELAAKICQKLMKAAVTAGSRENLTVMVILLQGLDVLGVQTQNRV